MSQQISTASRYQRLASSQEEADTKMILHAVEVGETKINIHSFDTDVFILCPKDTLFVTEVVRGDRK